MRLSVAVIGGGAAGLAAAVAAAERGCAVTVYEASDRVGRSILATGNGRCNFSNALLDVSAYHNSAFASDVFQSLARAADAVGLPSGDAVGLSSDDAVGLPSDELRTNAQNDAVLSFFRRHGLCWDEEAEGRLYPTSRKASTVLDVLRFSGQAAGVEVCCNTRIASIEPPRAADKPFTLRTSDGVFKRADAVIVAVGGTVARTLLPDDVPFVEQRGVLGPLATNTELVRQLDNTRVRCEVVLRDPCGAEKARECGEVLFRKYGVSGIAIFNLSRFAQPGDTLQLSFVPHGVEKRSVVTKLEARFDILSSVYAPLTAESFLRGMFAGMVGEVLCKYAGISFESPLTRAQLADLAQAITAFTLKVQGLGDASRCQVHRGGVAVGAVDSRTMELQSCPGLYVVGEALDVDGPCGGYNLHWAWASGLLAALSLAQ